jgi:hypothetical protein
VVVRSDSDVRTPVVGGARGEAVGCGGVRTAALSAGTFIARARGAWQPRGVSALTGGPSVGSGG